jgi:two-component sensor histidine kinase
MEQFKGEPGVTKTATSNEVLKLVGLLARMRFGKLMTVVGGDGNSFSLEHRIFNISSFFITSFAFLGGIANYLVGLVAPVVWLSFLGSAISFIIFYFARFRHRFNVYVSFSYILATIAILSVMNFYNGGLDGTIIYLIIMLLNIFLLIVPRGYQFWALGLLYLNILVLLVLEFNFPQWVVPYHSSNERLVDHAVTMLYSMFYTALVIIYFRKSYKEEQDKVTRQNTQLKGLNEQIEENRYNLESKTEALEAAVALANDRHENIKILLRELNHRVKNNLQVVSSLLNLQANAVSDPQAKSAILESKNRLLSMILIHQRIYLHENATQIYLPDYLKELSESIMYSFRGQAGGSPDILQFEIDEVWLNVDKAIPVGLIANELVTNCFKHTIHKKADGRITVKFKNTSTGYLLSVCDNGDGFVENQPRKSFGLELVRSLVRQLEGDCQVVSNKGTCWDINFK